MSKQHLNETAKNQIPVSCLWWQSFSWRPRSSLVISIKGNFARTKSRFLLEFMFSQACVSYSVHRGGGFHHAPGQGVLTERECVQGCGWGYGQGVCGQWVCGLEGVNGGAWIGVWTGGVHPDGHQSRLIIVCAYLSCFDFISGALFTFELSIFCLIRIAKPQYKDVYRRTIEMPQRSRTFKVNCCLKVHNAHLKLLSPISG